MTLPWICFRPLPRGLFFNLEEKKTNVVMNIGCFRPLPRGLFFNKEIDALNAKMDTMFSSPSSGTFFQY